MQLTQKLLGYLNRVFDKGPKPFVALRVGYDGGLAWRIEEGVITFTTTGGSGSSVSYVLADYTVESLASDLASRSGFQVSFIDAERRKLNARVLLDGAGDIGQSNGNALMGYTSILWAYLEAYAVQLTQLRDQMTQAVEQINTTTADDIWLDEIGSYYGVPRQNGEADANYGPRITAEAIRPLSNNVAIELAIQDYTGQPCEVEDVTVYLGVFPIYDGAILYDGEYNYDTVGLPNYGLFDVTVAYDLVNGGDISTFLATVQGIVGNIRAAGTHMRALALSSNATPILDNFTVPTESVAVMTVVEAGVTENFSAPTEDTTMAVGYAPYADSFGGVTEAVEGEIFTPLTTNDGEPITTDDGDPIMVSMGPLFGPPPIIDFDWIEGSFRIGGVTYTDFAAGTIPGLVTSRTHTNIPHAYMEDGGVLYPFDADVARWRRGRGLLVEPASTNYINFSTDTTQWNVNVSAVRIADSVIAPDGEMTADSVETADAGNGIYKVNTGLPLGVMTWSRFVKHIADGATVYFGRESSPNAYADMDIANGVFTSVPGSIDRYSIADMADDWYRPQATFTAATDTNVDIIYKSGPGPATFSPWGMQLEPLPYATSPMLTGASLGQRSNEYNHFPSMAEIGGEMTVFAEVEFANAPSSVAPNTRTIFVMANETYTSILMINNRLGGIGMMNLAGGGDAEMAQINDPRVHNPGEVVRIAVRMKEDDFQLVVNGVSSGIDNVADLATYTRMKFGCTIAGNQGFGGLLRAVRVYDMAMTEAEMLELTAI